MQRMFTVILACLSMAGSMAIDMFLPSIPAIGREFAVSPLAVQQTLSIFLFPLAVMMLFYGTLSDSFGRRPVLLVALTVFTLASLGAAFAPSFGVLLACRALQGMSAGAGSVIYQAIVQDRYAHDPAQAQKILSHIMIVFGLAPVITPALGGWLQASFGWQSVFVFMTGFGALMIALVYHSLPESLPMERRSAFRGLQVARDYLRVLRNRQFLLLAISVGMAFSGMSLYMGSGANFVTVILKQPATAFGWLFIPLIGGMVIGSVWGGKAGAKIAPARMVWLGFGIMVAAGAINVAYNTVFVAAVPWAVLPLALYTFGLAVALPAIQVSALALFPENRGLGSSMLSFIQMLLFALVSGLAAPLLFDSALNLAWGMLAGLLVSFASWRLSLRVASPALQPA